MEEVCNLLFELSNFDRLNILLELRNKPMKLSRVSEKFNFTVPETARNISRLANAGLIAKDAEGCFHLTFFGEASLQFLPNFEFISKNAKYFMAHTISNLPQEYAESIGVFNQSEFAGTLSESIFNIENGIREAEKFIWICVDQIIASLLPLFMDALDRGVEVRKIMPRNASVPSGILKLANDPFFEIAARAKKLESRYMDEIDVHLIMTEKEVATIGFKNRDGCFDLETFRAKNEAALNWAKSLFQHFWESSKRQ